MSDLNELSYLAARDAATREREQRLEQARKKLRMYRQRQGSKASTSTDPRSSRRESQLIPPSTELTPTQKQIHRRSLSKSGAVGFGHSKRNSHSRTASRNSFSTPKPKGHGHTRSRASVSISVSAKPDESLLDLAPAGPIAWATSPSLPPVASTSSAPPPAAASAAASRHGRGASRHSRNVSVSNFRESIEVVSGQGVYTGALQPTMGSFEGLAPPGTASETNSPALLNAGSPGQPLWSNDSAKVLEALRERGRRESTDSGGDARSALEALEGRVGAPSEIISLGNSPTGELLIAPKSPGYTTGANSPLGPSPLATSPMIGLGVSGKRASWSTPGPVTAQGAVGVNALGSLAEEDEDECEADSTIKSLPSPRRRGSPKRNRPQSLRLGAAAQSPSDAVAVIDFATAPYRTATPPNASVSPSADTPTPPKSRNSLRTLSLSLAGSLPTPPANPTQADERVTTPGEQRRLSLFQNVANSSTPPDSAPTKTTPRSGGLRSLSIGSSSIVSDPASRTTSPVATRTSSAKRSSISYRNSSVQGPPSATSPSDALSSAGGRRAWHNAVNQKGATHKSRGNRRSFYGPSDGQFGGFGDLEVEGSEEDEGPESPTRLLSPARPLIADDAATLTVQVSALKQQLSQSQSHVQEREVAHANDLAEFEKKAAGEARSMRQRIVQLEQTTEEANTRHAFAVEGLTRELDQAREAMTDLTEERDSLLEDIDGWRTRCQSLEKERKKDKEDDALARAQAKLIGEMRDQIYTLVAALEREKGEHAETRQEVERIQQERATQARLEDALDEYDEEAQIGSSTARHYGNSMSEHSILSTSSFGRSFSGNTTEDTSINTDLDESFSQKLSSPPFTHSLAGSVESRLDFAVPVANALAVLAEEDEEETVAGQDHGARGGSASTGSSTSDVLPLTPSKEATVGHNRAGSFVRHWSFPKGSVSSLRNSSDVEQHFFFDVNRHASLPPLPIPENVLPPFLCADLELDETTPIPFKSMSVDGSVSHSRRPSSPRPADHRLSKRVSRDWKNQAPPPAASAYQHAQLQSVSSVASAPAAIQSRGALARLSMGLVGYASFGSWGSSPTGSVSSPLGKMPATTAVVEELAEEDEARTPPSLSHSAHVGKAPRKLITAAMQPVPTQSRWGLLDFRWSVAQEVETPIFDC